VSDEQQLATGLRPLADLSLTDEVVSAVLEAAPDAVLLVDSAGRIVLANQQVETMFGYDRAELLGQSVDVLVPDAARGQHAQHRARYSAAPRTRAMGVGLQLAGRRRDGSLVPVDIALSPVRAEGETFTIAIVRDITERVEAQERLVDAGRQVALLEDRERIARDLHDRVIQRLFAAGLALQALATTTDDPELVARLERSVDDIDESIRDLRTVIFGLARRNARKGLRDAILALVVESSRALSFEPRVRFNGPVDSTVPQPLWEHALAALREILTNIAKHAHATEVDVDVDVDDMLRVRVVDNGVGIANVTSNTGEGLRNLESRARSLGGSFNAERGAASGTVVEWTVPLAADALPG
jgi:two-component system, NarL family, sensor histidine kinase DevS